MGVLAIRRHPVKAMLGGSCTVPDGTTARLPVLGAYAPGRVAVGERLAVSGSAG